MALDYLSIRAENQRRYGTDIGRIGPMLLADRYADRTHFIFELLQNAEDALARRPGWEGSRAVTFALSSSNLRVSHFGRPFDEADVRGICGIAQSTKGLTSIGRFGIGFKSVYAFTDSPQVHSGGEDFAIENFVWPVEVPATDRSPDETLFVLPLRDGDSLAASEIKAGLHRLGPRILLFLREIEEISWKAEGGASGLYLRSKPERVGDNCRKIVLVGESHDTTEVIEETWLVFSREVYTSEGRPVGHVKIAFALSKGSSPEDLSIQPISESPLVAFFPTILSTNLGFIVQGPYRTTPSRDNVPQNNRWNQHLIKETAGLLVDALRELRDLKVLDVNGLRSLPIDRSKFGTGTMFSPLFDAVRGAFSTEPLLPTFDSSYVTATEAKLARTQELRELFTPTQLGALYEESGDLVWLSGDITQDRTPDFRQYLMRELGITEVTPEIIFPKLEKSFLEAQTDEWIRLIYEFLLGQQALMRRLADIPLVRLDDGTHVTVKENGQLNAFLPSDVPTGFPTVRRTVCSTHEARKFLESLGLTEPDPVDDVIWNVLPRYTGSEVDVGDDEYEADVGRILTAFATDSKVQRDKLVTALREAAFVMVVDTGDGSKWVSKPGEVYLATQRLKDLFEGIAEVLIVDDSYSCLKGEDVRELLEACGATRYLQPIAVTPKFTWQECTEMRRSAGCENSSGGESFDDWTIRGLDELLATLPTYDLGKASGKAELLWEALHDMEERRGSTVFSGAYRWYYYHQRSCQFDAAFVRRLNEAAWVPDSAVSLQSPSYVVFQNTGWKLFPFLLSKIRFKPPIIEALAKEAGIEPGLLDLLKKLGVTSEAELKSRLGIKDEDEQGGGEKETLTADEAIEKLLGGAEPPTLGIIDSGGEGLASAGTHGRDGSRTPPAGRQGGTGGGNGGSREPGGKAVSGLGKKETPGSEGGRIFISYIATHPDDEPDPDGLEHNARVALEEKAIKHILEKESELRRTPVNNPGFDLFEAGQDGEPVKWVEVKAMKGNLTNRPVGLSRPQFECAQEHGDAYWLYVVEHAGDAEHSRIVRIQDPAGKAKTFTFDRGWLAVAEVDEQADVSEIEQETKES